MPHRNNRRRVIGGCVTVIVLAVLVLGGMACFEWGRASGDASRATHTDELNGCRASYRATMVDTPETEALNAVAKRDEAALHRALAKSDLQKYERLVDLSQKDPAAFLRRCTRDGFGSSAPG